VIRTLTPAAAGTSGLPFRKFLPAAASGALCWSLVHISIGAALGEAAKKVESALNTGGLVVLGVLAAALVYFLLRYKKKKALGATASRDGTGQDAEDHLVDGR
jgi:membrane-associated protein